MKISCTLAALCFAALAVFAQDYPTRAIRVVVPWPPGQNTDVAARLVSERLAGQLGQPIVVENRPGAGGIIGTDVAAKAPSDGYTLLAASSGPISISPHVQKVPFDVQRDLAPVSLLLVNPFVLVVNPSLPVGDVKDLVALLKANPGKYSFASSGAGATSHLMSVLFNSMAGVEAVHVPYKGSAQSVMDVVNGQVAYTIETVSAVIGLVRAGKLRAIGVTTSKRCAAMPEIPPLAEAGIPGYDVPAWVGIMAPAGTPRELRAKLAERIRSILDTPAIKDQMIALGMEPAASTPEEFAAFLRQQDASYGAIVKMANLKAD